MSDFLIAFLLIFILLAVIIMLQAKMLNLLKNNRKIEEKTENKQDFIKTGNEDEYIVPAIICAIYALDEERDFVVKSIKQEDNGYMLYSVLNSNSCDE
jgi:ribosomal protein S19